MTEQPAAPAAQDPLHASAPRVPFTKGHGTGNDFVLIADPDGNTIQILYEPTISRAP